MFWSLAYATGVTTGNWTWVVGFGGLQKTPAFDTTMLAASLTRRLLLTVTATNQCPAARSIT